MIATHIRQAWQLLRQNKLFSTIYIVGTALAIASTTIFAIIYYVKLTPVYPESNRYRMATIDRVEQKDDWSSMQSSLSYSSIGQFKNNLKSAELISAYQRLWGGNRMTFNDGRRDRNVTLRPTDTAFFKIFNYDLLAGAPFSDVDFESGVRKAVISDRLAEEVFGSVDEAVGKTVTVDFRKYDVCGVIREGSAINRHSFADVIIPYTVFDNYAGNNDPDTYTGKYKILLLTDDLPAVQAEIKEMERKYESSHPGKELNFWNQPQSAAIDALGIDPVDEDFDLGKFVRYNFLVLLTLLLVPALNLSGMIAGRMESRSGELGVRKSFGATDGSLMSQVLWENLILTVIGGAIGLGLTWITLSTDATFVLSIIGEKWFDFNSAATVRLTPDMMFAPAIFLFAFGVCIVLNLLSAALPAWLALRRPIVKSLK